MDGTRTVYFGYGSNLWLHQMKLRCPDSTYLGIARLQGYRWMINDRGYANIVRVSDSATTRVRHTTYGLVFSLSPRDEQRLDINEGVPIAYTKEHLAIDFWPARPNHEMIQVDEKPQQRTMLVYIDRKRTKDCKPKEEYVHRINMGIDDATKRGVPWEYIDKVLRLFIPEQLAEGHKAVAERQAIAFQDET